MKRLEREFPDLAAVRALARARLGSRPDHDFCVPAFLLVASGHGAGAPTGYVSAGEPYRYFLEVIDELLARPASAPVDRRGLHVDDTVYLSFIRTFAALDGRIGTAISQIAFLPHLCDRLGATVFMSLPTGLIGRANRKGERGSPFAVSDPFRVDPSLADPLFAELTPEVQYRALIQACHLLGMRAGSIVPMATLALDSPLFARHPDLGFWWDGRPGELLCAPPDAPVDAAAAAGGATGEAERTSEAACAREAVIALPERFADPPSPGELTTVGHEGERLYLADVGGRRLTLANAFPAHQGRGKAWGDVAMVNYTARNDPLPAGTLAVESGDSARPAWSLMAEQLDWRHATLGEDVFLIDVCPSVPPGVLELARARANERGPRRRGMTLIGEELWSFAPSSRALDGVVGPLVYGVGAHTRNLAVAVSSLRHHLSALEHRHERSAYLAGLSNHDTLPPTPESAAMLALCYAFLPDAVPLIFSGSEFYAQVLTNAEFGSDVTDASVRQPRERTDAELALFNDRPLDWDALPKSDRYGRPLVDLPRLISALGRMRRALTELGSWDYRFVASTRGEPARFGYSLRCSELPAAELAVQMNWSARRTVALDGGVGAIVVAAVHARESGCGLPGLHELAESSGALAGPVIELAPCSAVALASPALARVLRGRAAMPVEDRSSTAHGQAGEGRPTAVPEHSGCPAAPWAVSAA